MGECGGVIAVPGNSVVGVLDDGSAGIGVCGLSTRVGRERETRRPGRNALGSEGSGIGLGVGVTLAEPDGEVKELEPELYSGKRYATSSIVNGTRVASQIVNSPVR
jgi:hypothetical protein